MEEPGRLQSKESQLDTTEGLHFLSLIAQLVKNPPAMQETWV